MREVLNANPIKLMQRLADQNISFLRSVLQPGEASESESKVHKEPNEPEERSPEQSVGKNKTIDRSPTDQDVQEKS